MTEGMLASRLAVLCTVVVISLIVWTLLLPPYVTDSKSDLQFKQCSFDVMTYVSICGKLTPNVVLEFFAATKILSHIAA